MQCKVWPISLKKFLSKILRLSYVLRLKDCDKNTQTKSTVKTINTSEHAYSTKGVLHGEKTFRQSEGQGFPQKKAVCDLA